MFLRSHHFILDLTHRFYLSYSETLSVARLLGLSLLQLATRLPTTPHPNVITLIAAQQRASLKPLTSTAKTARTIFDTILSITPQHQRQLL